MDMITYIFSINSRVGTNRLIVIEGEDKREDAIQKAKIEILSPLKPYHTDSYIINLFHDMEFSFMGTVMVEGGSYRTKNLN